MADPRSNPVPRSDTPAYTPDNPVTREADGSAIREVIAKSGIAQRPAPKVRQPRHATTGRWKARP